MQQGNVRICSFTLFFMTLLNSSLGCLPLSSRNELFRVSGVRGQYPQFFLVDNLGIPTYSTSVCCDDLNVRLAAAPKLTCA